MQKEHTMINWTTGWWQSLFVVYCHRLQHTYTIQSMHHPAFKQWLLWTSHHALLSYYLITNWDHTHHPTQVNTACLSSFTNEPPSHQEVWTLNSQTGTQFTYPRGMEGWVDLSYIQRRFTHPQTDTHPSTNPAAYSQESNSWPVDQKSNAQSTTLPNYLIFITFKRTVVNKITGTNISTKQHWHIVVMSQHICQHFAS